MRAFGIPKHDTKNSFLIRAAAGDITLLHDQIMRCSADLDAIGLALEKEIEPKPTEHLPGSPEKVEEFARRFANGKKIFADLDR